MNEQVIEESSLQKYFSSIPHLVVDDPRLTRDDRALYLYYKRVTGERGICFQSNKTAADGSNLGTTLLKESRSRLAEFGYIKVVETPGSTTLVTLTDVWDENFAKYAGGRVATALPGRVATPPRTPDDQGVDAARQGGGRVATPKKNTLRKIHEEESSEEESAPAHPFVVLYGENYRRNNGRPTPMTDLAAALLLEKDFGASACAEVAAAYTWQKHPNYYRPILEERRNGNAGRPGGGEPDEAADSSGVGDGVPGLDRRSAAVARLGRGYRATA